MDNVDNSAVVVADRLTAPRISNKMPQSNGDRHFPFADLASVVNEDAADSETKDLRRLFLSETLERHSLLPNRPHRIKYATRKQDRHNPYILKGYYYTVLRVQNLPFMRSCERDDANRVSADHLCAMMKSIIDALHYSLHGTNYPHQVSIRCTPDFSLPFFEFKISHDHPLPTSHLPVADRCTPRGGVNTTFPILMDRTCLHVGSEIVMKDYTDLFATKSTKGRRFMIQKDRHYLSAGLPCCCVRIQVVSYSVPTGNTSGAAGVGEVASNAHSHLI